MFVSSRGGFDAPVSVFQSRDHFGELGEAAKTTY